MYDAEVGSSGGRCESGPWIDVVEERVGISQERHHSRGSPCTEAVNMRSKQTEAEIPSYEDPN